MREEIKICVPPYKAAYALCFAVLLSLVRGISSVGEIGITLDADMPILAIIFCADTYRAEYNEKRWEVFALYSVDLRTRSMRRRLGIQFLFLWLVTFAGYVCFFWQQPSEQTGVSNAGSFVMCMAAVLVSVAFWGTLAMILSNICRSNLAGAGISIFLWLILNSKSGEALLGNFNIFAFVFRDIERVTDMGWLLGKGLGIVLVLVMIGMLPVLIRKRG